MRKKIAGLTETLLDEAKKEFLQCGYKDASLRNIAKNANMTTGAIYRRYSDKEALFDAVVDPVRCTFMDMFQASQAMFFDMAEQGLSHLSYKKTANEVSMFLDYVYAYKDIFLLILCHAEGTKHQFFINDLVVLEVEVSRKYYDLLQKKGKLLGNIHPHVHTALILTYYTSIFEIIKLDITKEEALQHIQSIVTFHNAGFESLVKFL